MNPATCISIPISLLNRPFIRIFHAYRSFDPVVQIVIRWKNANDGDEVGKLNNHRHVEIAA